MKEFAYVITDKAGIHARPAGIVARTAQKYMSEILVGRGDVQTDAKKLMQLMALGVKNGEEIRVTVEGKDEREAAAAMENVLKENL